MKEQGQIKQVSAFSLIVACALCFTSVTTITKQVPRYYTRYFYTVNTMDEILSTAIPKLWLMTQVKQQTN